MSTLNNKIPPPVVALIFAAISWGLAEIAPPSLDYNPNYLIAGAFFTTGLSIALTAIYLFFKQKTTINPHTPHKSSSLVITGLYKITRNPMYLGLLLILTALAVMSANVISLCVLPGFIAYINQFQIKPEESHLITIFGEDYINYKKQVRRWL